MKKRLLLISTVLAFGLVACGQSAEEVTPTPTLAPDPEPTIMATAAATPEATTTTAPMVTLTPEPAPTAVTATPVPASVPTATAKPTPKPVPTPSPIPAPEPTPEVIATLEPEPSEEGRPSDEEVLEAYREAAEVFSWFAGYGEPELDTNDRIDITMEGWGNEITLCRVASPELNSTDELRAYLKTLFSDEVVDGLFKNASATFVDGPDGGLYTTGVGRGSNINKGGVVLSVLWPPEGGDVLCYVQVEVELLDEETLSAVVGSEHHEFPYQKVGDKWVFTQFTAIF